MTRQFYDRCNNDITSEKSGHVTGVNDADEQGSGNVTDEADLCEVCYKEWITWLHTKPFIIR